MVDCTRFDLNRVFTPFTRLLTARDQTGMAQTCVGYHPCSLVLCLTYRGGWNVCGITSSSQVTHLPGASSMTIVSRSGVRMDASATGNEQASGQRTPARCEWGKTPFVALAKDVKWGNGETHSATPLNLMLASGPPSSCRSMLWNSAIGSPGALRFLVAKICSRN